MHVRSHKLSNPNLVSQVKPYIQEMRTMIWEGQHLLRIANELASDSSWLTDNGSHFCKHVSALVWKSSRVLLSHTIWGQTLMNYISEEISIFISFQRTCQSKKAKQIKLLAGPAELTLWHLPKWNSILPETLPYLQSKVQTCESLYGRLLSFTLSKTHRV